MSNHQLKNRKKEEEMKRKKKNQKREEETKRRKKQIVSSSEESSDDSEEEEEEEDEEEEEEMNQQEYRQFLKTLFPSKHMDRKIQAGNRLRRVIKDKKSSYKKEKGAKEKRDKKKKRKDEEEEEDDDEEDEADDEEDDEDDDYEEEADEEEADDEEADDEEADDEDDEADDEEEEDDDDYEDEEADDEYISEEEDKEPKPTKNINIVFTIENVGKKKTTERHSLTDEGTENEDDTLSSEEDGEGDEVATPPPTMTKSKKNLSTDSLTTYLTEDKAVILNQLREVQAKNPHDKSIAKCILTYENEIRIQGKKLSLKIKKEKDRNSRIFKKILMDKNTMNDFEFYKRLSTDQQKKIIKELREINKITRIEKPYRLTLLESDIPVIFKSVAMKKISSLRYMEAGSGEYYKIKNWVDTFMRIPFGKWETLPISIEDGVDKCHAFMETSQQILDSAVYGLNDAKMQIMQLLGQLIANPKAIGSAIAIHGPPGTGKTSLVKEGISKILNRPFAFIALGGATDSSFLEGHGYTYEGSTWGKIVQILIDSKCMNPVIYFDELDKISDTPKGEEIAGILTHLTDTSQNTQFHDKYFAEIDFDLSKCLFIFSYNDETKINPILKDRMYRIQTKGYSSKQKNVISRNYLLPKIREQVKFQEPDIVIPDATLGHLIENFCNKEDGVRNLKRCLEIIHTKLNLYRLMRPGSNLFEEDMSLKVEFPFTVTKDVADKLIKKPEGNGITAALYGMYV